jgi:hypothetical protein
VAAALLVGGCQTTPGSKHKPSQIEEEGRSVIAQPFKDINLVHDEIPALLVKEVANPYVEPDPFGCEAIDQEIIALNDLLGPDFDEPHDPDAGVTRQKAVDLVRDAASSFIPLRGLVRWVSGADKHVRQMRRAILAGNVRRGYLKGLRNKLHCSGSFNTQTVQATTPPATPAEPEKKERTAHAESPAPAASPAHVAKAAD